MIDYDADKDVALLRLLVGSEDDEMWTGFVTWLVREATPDERHRVSKGWNWDQGREVLAWIVSQADCDRATALHVFWNAQPEYYLDHGPGDPFWSPSNQEDLDLLNDLRAGWREGRYTRGEIAFNLDDYGYALDTLATLDARFGERAAAALPPDMRASFPGRTLATADDIEGIPARFWPEELR